MTDSKTTGVPLVAYFLGAIDSFGSRRVPGGGSVPARQAASAQGCKPAAAPGPHPLRAILEEALREGQTPAILAVEWYVRRKPSLCADDFSTLIATAIEKGRPDILLTLGRVKGCREQVNVFSHGGGDSYTPLHFAALRGGNPDVIDALIAIGADPALRTGVKNLSAADLVPEV